MKKWTTFLLLASLQLHGWGRSMEGQFQQENSSKPSNFLINEDQGWFIENSYLLMKPTLENLDFANLVTQSTPASYTTDTDVSIKKPDFSWGSGVRLVVGRYLPHHDHWDVSVNMTYFYGDADQTMHASPVGTKGLTPTYGAINDGISGSFSSLKGSWHLNYFTWDLALGREVAMTRSITFHPFVALRAALMYQDYSLKGNGLNEFFGLPLQYQFKSHNSFWAVGPRIGSHLGYYMKHNWSVLGELSAALVYGPYENHISQKSTTSGDVSPNPIIQKTKDSSAWLRGNLEGSVGLGWEAWMKNKTVRIFPQLLFEGSLWWDMNRYFDTKTLFSESHGALALMGVSFNLQVDF